MIDKELVGGFDSDEWIPPKDRKAGQEAGAAAACVNARTIDIHRKPGYDPCELFIDPAIPFGSPRLW